MSFHIQELQENVNIKMNDAYTITRAILVKERIDDSGEEDDKNNSSHADSK